MSINRASRRNSLAQWKRQTGGAVDSNFLVCDDPRIKQWPLLDSAKAFYWASSRCKCLCCRAVVTESNSAAMLKLLAAQTGLTQEQLVAEGLNMVFAKHNKSQIAG